MDSRDCYSLYRRMPYPMYLDYEDEDRELIRNMKSCSHVQLMLELSEILKGRRHKCYNFDFPESKVSCLMEPWK